MMPARAGRLTRFDVRNNGCLGSVRAVSAIRVRPNTGKESYSPPSWECSLSRTQNLLPPGESEESTVRRSRRDGGTLRLWGRKVAHGDPDHGTHFPATVPRGAALPGSCRESHFPTGPVESVSPDRG